MMIITLSIIMVTLSEVLMSQVLQIAEKHTSLRRATSSRHTGPCPKCGGNDRSSDRFSVYVDKEDFHCFACGFNGDAITLLRELENMTCPEAHKALGKECQSNTCPHIETCSASGRAGLFRKKEETARKSVTAPVKNKNDRWQPGQAENPANLWQQHADKLVELAHRSLLENPEQLRYLEQRGLPLEAVVQYRLGWIPSDLFRESAAWGIDAEISDKTGKPKKLWIPQGLLIPFFKGNAIHRIRIRRAEVKENEPRYYWMPGSGNDTIILGTDLKAFVVVESDLDGYATAWAGRELAGAVALGTCSAKPKGAAAEALDRALCILTALDFEPRGNPRTGQHENPGGKASLWWEKTYRQSARWPVPSGKDIGDYVKDGGDLRQWILAGLRKNCPVLAIASPVAKNGNVEAEETPEAPPAAIAPALYIHGQSKNGHDYYITEKAEDAALLRAQFPGEAVFTQAEILKLKGMTPEEAEKFILVKRTFPESRILQTQVEQPCR